MLLLASFSILASFEEKKNIPRKKQCLEPDLRKCGTHHPKARMALTTMAMRDHPRVQAKTGDGQICVCKFLVAR